MRNFIESFKIINAVAYETISKYILHRIYRLRGFYNLENKAIKSSFLYDIAREGLIDSNLTKAYKSSYIDKLINEIRINKGLVEVYDISKHKRPDYNKWLRSKSLCTYYENWEQLAYTVCEKYSIDIDISEVVCDIIMDIAATSVECLLEENIQAELIECKTNTDITTEEIKCDPSVDIKTIAEECLINTDEIKAEVVACENKVDIKAFAELCSIKYNIDNDLIECIISDLFPEAVHLNGKCYTTLNINNAIIEITEEESN